MHKDGPRNAHLSSTAGGSAILAEVDHASGLFVIACLFAVAGGYMDAYSYLAHGHVFANAQTGNFVFFSVYASGGQWGRAARHLPPIVAFSLGVVVSKLLGLHSHEDSFRVTLLCQGVELSILAALAVVGDRLPNVSVVPIISFVAALQNASFDRVGSWPFNSAMVTGNLRDAISGLVLWIAGREPVENRRKAITLGLICISFVAGALCGGGYTRLGVGHALLPCLAVVVAASLLTWRRHRMHIPHCSQHRPWLGLVPPKISECDSKRL
jgi:uncharacterized membrane protein YoaK (UPF0700 family)